MLTLEKLDRRHSGNTRFTHRVFISGMGAQSNGKKFLELREWCWNTLGPSCELSLCYLNEATSWAWRMDDQKSFNQYYIYLTEEARTHFALKWI